VAAASVTVTLEWHSTRQYGGRVNTPSVLKYVTITCVTAILREHSLNSNENMYTGKEKFYT